MKWTALDALTRVMNARSGALSEEDPALEYIVALRREVADWLGYIDGYLVSRARTECRRLAEEPLTQEEANVANMILIAPKLDWPSALLLALKCMLHRYEPPFPGPPDDAEGGS